MFGSKHVVCAEGNKILTLKQYLEVVEEDSEESKRSRRRLDLFSTC